MSTRTWQGPSAPERLALLHSTRSIAIVGASNNPARASYFVATYLLSSSPYDVYFVNPRADEILGRPVYPSLESLPVVPDLVDVFRRHDDLPTVARRDPRRRARRRSGCSSGSWHEDVARRGEAAGLTVVMDRCLKIEHARFHGGLHLAGLRHRRHQLQARAGLTSVVDDDYAEAVLDLVAAIPAGRAMTYGTIAEVVGDLLEARDGVRRGGPRQVGQVHEPRRLGRAVVARRQRRGQPARPAHHPRAGPARATRARR